jgi:hypothetical protein
VQYSSESAFTFQGYWRKRNERRVSGYGDSIPSYSVLVFNMHFLEGCRTDAKANRRLRFKFTGEGEMSAAAYLFLTVAVVCVSGIVALRMWIDYKLDLCWSDE